MRATLQNVGRFISARGLKWFLVGVTASVVLSVIEAGVAVFLQVFLKVLGIAPGVQAPGLLGEWRPNPVQLGLVLIAIGIARGVCQFLVCQSGVVAQETLNSRLRLLLLYRMLLDPKQGYMPASEVNLRISEHFPKAARFVEASTYLISNSVVCIVLAAFMLHLAWREALLGIVGLGIAGAVVLRLNRVVAKAATEIPLRQTTLLQGIERVARNWLLVKVLRTGQREHARLSDSVLSYAANVFRAGFFTYSGAVMPPMLGIVLIVAIISAHFTWWNEDNTTLLAFLYLFIRFSQYVGTVATYFGAAITTMPQARMAYSYFAELPRENAVLAMRAMGSVSIVGRRADGLAENTAQASAAVERFAPPRIVFENVAFSYPNAEKAVLSDLSLTIEGGRQFGIVGTSGSGKSTLLALLLGVVKPESGRILLDGEPPERYFARLGMQVGYVGVDPFLIGGTIRDNLHYGARRQYDDEQCWDALRRANLDTTVHALPGSLSYEIKENGDGLSAGQKQRLALARSFLANPPLLVLDEVTANLDDHTEAAIAGSLRSLKKECTVVIVSHKKGTLIHADQVLTLDREGRAAMSNIREEGA